MMTIVKVLLIGILILAGSVLVKQTVHVLKTKERINREIDQLKREAEKYNQQNQELRKMIEYFNSPELREKEIKEKLNVVSPGEKMVVVQPGPQEQKVAPKKQNKKIVIKRANYYQWWQYFFGDDATVFGN